MKTINKIFTIIVLAALVVGCTEQDIFPSNGWNTVPEGAVRTVVDMSKLGFSDNVIKTHAGSSPTTATEYELDVSKGMYAFVFKNDGDVGGELLEVRRVQVGESVDPDGTKVQLYYADLKQQTGQPVRIVGLANLPPNYLQILNELIGLDANVNSPAGTPTFVVNTSSSYAAYLESNLFTYNTMLTLLSNIEYVNEESTPSHGDNSFTFLNFKGTHNYLPVYTKSYKLDELTQAEIDATKNKVIPVFAYTRIDVMLNPNNAANDNVVLESYYVTDAPKKYADPNNIGTIDRTGKRSFIVKNTDQILNAAGSITGVYPTGIDDTNYNTHYLRGLYVLPTFPLEGVSIGDFEGKQDETGTYILLKAQRPERDLFGNLTGEIKPVYYKLMLEYTHTNPEFNEGKLSTGSTFFLHNNDRLLINISSLDASGYDSEEEALAAPPSNVDYEITVNEEFHNFEVNGQYLFAIERDNYVVNLRTTKSHLAYSEKERGDSFEEAGDVSDFAWVFDEYGNGTLEFTISIEAGENPEHHEPIQLRNIKQAITGLPAGVTLEYVKGSACYDNSSIMSDAKRDITPNSSQTDPFPSEGYSPLWHEYFGNHTFKITIPKDFGTVILDFKVGNLGQSITFGETRNIITDYSSRSFVNYLAKLLINCSLLMQM